MGGRGKGAHLGEEEELANLTGRLSTRELVVRQRWQNGGQCSLRLMFCLHTGQILNCG